VSKPIGVGFLGAGPVTQAVHVPALSALGERFRIVTVMDVDASLASAVAARVGATATTSVDHVLADPAVDVVAVCSPNDFHADQVIAACAAGKRAVLCEKPLAMTADEAQLITAASVTRGVPIVVGTMHAYDSAVIAALDAWAEHGEQASYVRSSIYLPRNRGFICAATSLAAPPSPSNADSGPEPRTLRDLILSLAIHAVPLMRRVFPEFDEVVAGNYVPPLGYFFTVRCGTRAAQLIGLMPTDWRPDWTLRAVSDRHELVIALPPSYVLSGSATAELSSPTGTRRWSFAENGYQSEWVEIERLVRGGARPRFVIHDAVEDLKYALRLIEGSTQESGGR
jgi:myo-inositol 2-dehydrogenase/D-chiro-inositol 1-dehydrogenase